MTVYRAKRLPKDGSVSGWYATLPEPGPCRELEEHITADWVIAGAGFAGIAAARRLRELRRGERIVMVDAQRIAWGAAGRNSGLMIDLPHEMQSENYTGGLEADRRQIRMNRVGIEYMRAGVEEFGLEAHFNPCGKLHGASSSRGLKALTTFARHLDSLGEPCTRLGADDLKRITGTGYFAGGLHTPGAAVIQPAGLVRGLADGVRNEVAIFENSPMVGIEQGADIVVHTPRGSVRTQKLILTVNGQLESFGFFGRRLVHVFTYASMTRPMTTDERSRLGGDGQWALVPADPMGTTVRRTRDDRIVVRNSFTFNPSMMASEAQLSNAARHHDRSFSNRFPMLGGMEMAYRWGGRLCLSLNAVPVFCEIERGIDAACCQNGLGTAKGTLNGKLIADLATGSNEPLVADMLSCDPPDRLPPQPFLGIGARLRLWWARVRAGSDF